MNPVNDSREEEEILPTLFEVDYAANRSLIDYNIMVAAAAIENHNLDGASSDEDKTTVTAQQPTNPFLNRQTYGTVPLSMDGDPIYQLNYPFESGIDDIGCLFKKCFLLRHSLIVG